MSTDAEGGWHVASPPEIRQDTDIESDGCSQDLTADPLISHSNRKRQAIDFDDDSRVSKFPRPSSSSFSIFPTSLADNTQTFNSDGNIRALVGGYVQDAEREQQSYMKRHEKRKEQERVDDAFDRRMQSQLTPTQSQMFLNPDGFLSRPSTESLPKSQNLFKPELPHLSVHSTLESFSPSAASSSSGRSLSVPSGRDFLSQQVQQQQAQQQQAQQQQAQQQQAQQQQAQQQQAQQQQAQQQQAQQQQAQQQQAQQQQAQQQQAQQQQAQQQQAQQQQEVHQFQESLQQSLVRHQQRQQENTYGMSRSSGVDQPRVSPYSGMSSMPGVSPGPGSSAYTTSLYNSASRWGYTTSLGPTSAHISTMMRPASAFMSDPVNQHTSNSFTSQYGDPATSQEDLKDLLKNIRPDEELTPEQRDAVPEGLQVKLMPHQALGVGWLRTAEDGSNKGGILADDMGLGKTLQAIALMLARPSPQDDRRPNLVVAPVALLQQWSREFEKVVLPSHRMSVLILHGPTRTSSYNAIRNYDVVLTSYGTLASELTKRVRWERRINIDPRARPNKQEECAILDDQSRFHRVFLDEAQNIKNRTTKSAHAAFRINSTFRCEFPRFLYTGVRIAEGRPVSSVDSSAVLVYVLSWTWLLLFHRTLFNCL